MRSTMTVAIDSRTRRPLRAVATVATMVLAGSASAADVADSDRVVSHSHVAEDDAVSDEARWAMSAGLHTLGFGLIRAFGMAGTSVVYYYRDSWQRPGIVGSLERRLSGQTWLLLQISGGHTNAKSDDLDDRAQISYGSVAAGVRRQLWQRGSAAVSGFATIGGFGEHSEGRAIGQQYRSSELGVRALGGISADYSLVDGLSVGLSTPLVAATFARSKLRPILETGAGGEPVKSKQWIVGLEVTPELRLRLAF